MSSPRKCNAFILLATLCLAGSGCVDRELAVSEPETQSEVFVKIQQNATTKVDLLFVIDNSSSMREEQEVLESQIVEMARELLHPTEDEETGLTPLPVEDLHVGIISTDMGTGGYSLDTCDNSNTGDDGALQNAGQLEGCESIYSASDCDRAECPWLVHSTEFPDDGSDPANPPIWDDFGCIASLGTEGCGFEQQLEASLAALTRQTDAGRLNEGFLREDSLLAIVYVTDEDDCSTPNPEMFNQRADYGPLNTRCALNPDELYPVERYVEGFLDLRPGREDWVVVAAITGVPIDGSWNLGDPIDRLADLQRTNPERPGELVPSCSTDMGLAYPPVRFAELVYAFGNNGILESICRNDWTAALQAITRKIQGKFEGTCVDRSLASNAADTCRVIETLHGDMPCAHPAASATADRAEGWHRDLGLDLEGNRRCEILPADYDGDSASDGDLRGWYYVAAHPDCDHGMVRFTDTDVTSDLSQIAFECRTALCAPRQACAPAAAAGAECDPNASGSCGAGEVCVEHNSGEVCGWTTVVNSEGDEVQRPLSCARCAPTIAATCPTRSSTWLEGEVDVLLDQPLFGSGGCCAEGFHCDGGTCAPDRAIRCL